MKHFFTALALLSTMLIAGTALAQQRAPAPAPAAATEAGPRPMGLRLEGSLGLFSLVAPLDVNPGGDLRVGYDLDSGFTPLIGLSYRRHSESTDYDDDAIKDTDSAVSIFTISLEGRYYLQKHRKGLQPFVWGELNTSFVSASENGDSDDAFAGSEDHTEFNLGFGAEYKFSRAFAIGGKWGLSIAFQPFEDKEADSNKSSTTFGTSSDIYFAWRM